MLFCDLREECDFGGRAFGGGQFNLFSDRCARGTDAAPEIGLVSELESGAELREIVFAELDSGVLRTSLAGRTRAAADLQRRFRACQLGPRLCGSSRC